MGRESELLSVRETADRLNLREPHVRALVRRAEIPSIRLGRLIRIPASSVRRLIDRAEGTGR
jgi:excisionase family DNA binding protein